MVEVAHSEHSTFWYQVWSIWLCNKQATDEGGRICNFIHQLHTIDVSNGYNEYEVKKKQECEQQTVIETDEVII